MAIKYKKITNLYSKGNNAVRIGRLVFLVSNGIEIITYNDEKQVLV